MTIFTDKDNYISDGRSEMKSLVMDKLYLILDEYSDRSERIRAKALIYNIIQEIEKL